MQFIVDEKCSMAVELQTEYNGQRPLTIHTLIQTHVVVIMG